MSKKGQGGSARVKFTVLNRVIRKVLTQKTVPEQRFEGDKVLSMGRLGETTFQHLQMLRKTEVVPSVTALH